MSKIDTSLSIIVAGTRTFNDYELLKRTCDELFINLDKINFTVEIVSGKAEGADSLGERYAKEHGFKIKEFPAKWEDLQVQPCIIRKREDGTSYNILAGPNRNKEMAEYADGAVIFWDGKSRGTKNMIELCREYDLKLKIINYQSK